MLLTYAQERKAAICCPYLASDSISHSSLPHYFSSAYYWVKPRHGVWGMWTGGLYGPFKQHFHVWCWKQQNCPSTKNFIPYLSHYHLLCDKSTMKSNPSLMHFMQLNAFEHWRLTNNSPVFRESSLTIANNKYLFPTQQCQCDFIIKQSDHL